MEKIPLAEKVSLKCLWRETYGGKDLSKKYVLSLERKSEGVMDGESGEEKDGLRYAQRGETGSRSEAGSWFQR